MKRQFAITDIHGCLKTFRALLEDQIQLSTDDELFLLGDYINKGPDSKGVLDYILELKKKSYHLFTLKGNHEQLLLDALDKNAEVEFMFRGGISTLKSFKTENISDIPENYIRFIREMDYYVILDKVILVHAGFNFRKMDPFTDKDAMLNTRNMEISDKITERRCIIHGHVPTPVEQILANLEDRDRREQTIDTGCVYNHIPGMNHLLALELNTWQPFVQKFCE